MTFSSAIPGFHKLTQDEKLSKLKELVNLTDEEINSLNVTKPPVTIENISHDFFFLRTFGSCI